VPPLTDPLAHGTASFDALSVVVPSLPGFGFSGPPPTGGLTRHQVAEVVHQHLSILVAGQ
jgi:epoxide hydrolase